MGGLSKPKKELWLPALLRPAPVIIPGPREALDLQCPGRLWPTLDRWCEGGCHGHRAVLPNGVTVDEPVELSSLNYGRSVFTSSNVKTLCFLKRDLHSGLEQALPSAGTEFQAITTTGVHSSSLWALVTQSAGRAFPRQSRILHVSTLTLSYHIFRSTNDSICFSKLCNPLHLYKIFLKKI